ncbi:MAG TPA: type II toxin-antitoxin system RelB/DinJ family antitoxin [Rhodopila sp.]|nr:type II toxin-antitoxin system RelB/DinJ family antitoxin [Rhodopila sp.]
MATEMLHVRVEEETKRQAAAALEAMGLSISEAVRVFLRRVAADKAIPFAIKVPNAATRSAMEEARTLSHARHETIDALFDALASEGE